MQVKSYYYRYTNSEGIQYRYLLHNTGNYEVYERTKDNFGNIYYRFIAVVPKIPIGSNRYSYNTANYKG